MNVGGSVGEPSIRNVDVLWGCFGGSVSGHQRVSTFQVDLADGAMRANITQEPMVLVKSERQACKRWACRVDIMMSDDAWMTVKALRRK